MGHCLQWTPPVLAYFLDSALTIKTKFSSPRRKVGGSQSKRRQCDGCQAIQMIMEALLGQNLCCRITMKQRHPPVLSGRAALLTKLQKKDILYQWSPRHKTHLPIDDVSLTLFDWLLILQSHTIFLQANFVSLLRTSWPSRSGIPH